MKTQTVNSAAICSTIPIMFSGGACTYSLTELLLYTCNNNYDAKDFGDYNIIVFATYAKDLGTLIK